MPTQRELAKLAGVSTGTVSNVISGSTPVSERSRMKVQKAIEALNYHPNLIARSLKTNRTNTLGMIIPDVTIPFFPKIVRGAESAARERGYFLIVVDSENNSAREREMLNLLRAYRVDGILLITVGGIQGASKDASVRSARPVVYLDRVPEGVQVDSVSVDDRCAAEMGVSHLLAQGHRDIAILTGPLVLKNEQERLRGYKQALQAAGVPIGERLIWKGSFNQDEIATICQQGLLTAWRRPSALFVTNGVTGLAALKAIYAAGLSTPKDLAFVTFDELTADDFFRPAVTTVVQPAFEIGYRAVELLLNRIESDATANSPQKVRLPGKLVVRESSNFAPRASSDKASAG